MAVQTDDLFLHAWQRMASKPFLRLIFSLQCNIMSDVPTFSPHHQLVLAGVCRLAEEFLSISQFLPDFSRNHPIQTTRMEQTALVVVLSKDKVLTQTLN
jgi:hypothetical protein